MVTADTFLLTPVKGCSFQTKQGPNLSPFECSNSIRAVQAKRFVIAAANWLLWCRKRGEPASNCIKNQKLMYRQDCVWKRLQLGKLNILLLVVLVKLYFCFVGNWCLSQFHVIWGMLQPILTNNQSTKISKESFSNDNLELQVCNLVQPGTVTAAGGTSLQL